MKRAGRVNILIVTTDGGRPLRVALPRWVAYAALASVAVVVATAGALVGDYVRVRELSRASSTLARQLEEKESVLDTLQHRIGEIRIEVSSWRAMHARIWEPFGPDIGPARRGRGMGGPEVQAVAVDAGASVLDEMDRLAETVDEEGQNLRALERLMGRAGKVLATLPSRWPVRGGVNSEFGMRASPWTGASQFHSGIDIGADLGTPVRAPASGTVVSAGRMGAYGLAVILEHRPDLRTLYGHLSKVHVTAGERVERGAIVGQAGSTGKSSGPHLHYEILVRGRSVNPRAYLWN